MGENSVKEKQKIALKVDALDNVATIFTEGIQAGDSLAVQGPQGLEEKVMAQNAIPYGHKIAVTDIPLGAAIVKYGQRIGVASQAIPIGGYVHVHNMEAMRGRGDRTQGQNETSKTGEEL